MTGFNKDENDIVLIDYGRASRYNEKNDFNILYNEIYMLSIPRDEKRHLLSILIPDTQPNGNPRLLDAADPKENVKTAEERMGFRRIVSKHVGARSGGFIRRQEDDDEDEED
jgi:hypothetical protein